MRHPVLQPTHGRSIPERCDGMITLSSHEMMLAATVGIMRQITNLRDKRADYYGAEAEAAWQIHIEGAIGEMVVAKHCNVFWNGNMGNLRAKDAGKLQVRTTRWPNGSLILHPKDLDDDIFVLVTGEAPNYTVRGWISGAEGKSQDLWEEKCKGRPAFFVPQFRLYTMDLITLV